MMAARDAGLLIGKGGLYGNVLRISPNLAISGDDIQAGCELIAKALTEIA
jgi:4-aminobutyrate aminotransferase-like enzyme